eukprot:365596-Chlamydomonas_euryale.AAC.21
MLCCSRLTASCGLIKPTQLARRRAAVATLACEASSFCVFVSKEVEARGGRRMGRGPAGACGEIVARRP